MAEIKEPMCVCKFGTCFAANRRLRLVITTAAATSGCASILNASGSHHPAGTIQLARHWSTSGRNHFYSFFRPCRRLLGALKQNHTGYLMRSEEPHCPAFTSRKSMRACNIMQYSSWSASRSRFTVTISGRAVSFSAAQRAYRINDTEQEPDNADDAIRRPVIATRRAANRWHVKIITRQKLRDKGHYHVCRLHKRRWINSWHEETGGMALSMTPNASCDVQFPRLDNDCVSWRHSHCFVPFTDDSRKF